MKQVTGEEAKMWGSAIIGFGSRKLVYESGHELDWMNIGLSPRKANITLYIMDGFAKYDALLSKLGKYKSGKSCLYIDKLENVDTRMVLETWEPARSRQSGFHQLKHAGAQGFTLRQNRGIIFCPSYLLIDNTSIATTLNA